MLLDLKQISPHIYQSISSLTLFNFLNLLSISKSFSFKMYNSFIHFYKLTKVLLLFSFSLLPWFTFSFWQIYSNSCISLLFNNYWQSSSFEYDIYFFGMLSYENSSMKSVWSFSIFVILLLRFELNRSIYPCLSVISDMKYSHKTAALSLTQIERNVHSAIRVFYVLRNEVVVYLLGEGLLLI